MKHIEKKLPDWSFPQATKREWLEAAKTELKGKNVKDLISKNKEGVITEPYYDENDLINLSFGQQELISAYHNPYGLHNYYSVKAEDGPQAKQAIHTGLNLGAQCIGIVQHDFNPGILETALNEAVTNILHIDLILNDGINNAVKQILDEKLQIINGSLNKIPEHHLLADLIRWADKKDNFFPISLSAGTSDDYAYENALMLAQLADLAENLENASLDHRLILKKLRFIFSLGQDFFMDAARIRGFKKVLNEVLRAYQLSEPATVIFHAIAPAWKNERMGPHESMLKGATNIIAAFVGGCNSYQVVPEDYTNDMQRRIAWHTANVLSEEAHLDKVLDPGRGAYFFENLTWQIAEKSLDKFKEIESMGGFSKYRKEIK